MKTIPILLIVALLFTTALKASAFRSAGKQKTRVTFLVNLDSSIRFKPYLIVYDNNFYDGITQPEQTEISPISVKGSDYVFVLKNQNKPMYFSLIYKTGKKTVFILDRFHFEPGDQIRMNIKKDNNPDNFYVTFSGRNSAKYRCQSEFKNEIRMESKKMKADSTFKYDDYNSMVRLIKVQQALVEKYRPEMSDFSYNLLRADLEGRHFKVLVDRWRSNLLDAINNNDKIAVDSLSARYSKNYQFRFAGTVTDSILFNSRYYARFALEKTKLAYLVRNRKPDFPGYFEEIKKTTNTRLRDKMFVVFFIRHGGDLSENYEKLLTNALSMVQDKGCLEKLKQFKRVFSGLKAYDFSLEDQNGQLVKLDDFKGKVVFIDFWFTGCGACKNFYEDVLSHVEKKYEDNPNIVFITISVDDSKPKWLSSINSGNYTSNKAVNLYTNGEGIKHEIIRFYNIVGYPRQLLIDRKGNIIKYIDDQLRDKDYLVNKIEQSLISK